MKKRMFHFLSTFLTVVLLAATSAAAGPKQDRIIVKVKESGKVQSLVQKHAVTVKKSFGRGTSRTLIISHPDTKGLEQRLKRDPDVEWVEPDRPVHPLDGETVLPLGETVLPLGPVSPTTDGQTIQQLLGETVLPLEQETIKAGYSRLASLVTPSSQLIIQPAFRRIGLYATVTAATGRGVKVAVVDTGVDTCHAALKGVRVFSFVEEASSSVGTGRAPEDCPVAGATRPPGFGHGTAVSSLIRVVAPEAEIWMMRVFDHTGTAQISDVAEAIVMASDMGAHVINMSFGTATPSMALADAIAYATAANVVTVAAAGNDGLEQVYYPAALSSTVAVAAVTNSDLKAKFSNYGSKILVSAPGVGLWAAYPGQLLTLASGTSFSAPLIAGEAALVIGQWQGGSTLDASVWYVWAKVAIGAQPIDLLQPVYMGKLGRGRLYLPWSVYTW